MACCIQILLLASCVYSLKAAFETHKDYQVYHPPKKETSRGKGTTVGEHSNKTLAHFNEMKVVKVERGMNTDNYSIFYRSARGPISPLHDIPLYSDYNKHIVNMIVETPAWTNEKMLINLKQPLNPITKGINIIPFVSNYGALPQTWQNPNQNDTFTGQKGDGNPLDVFDIGRKTFKAGDIIQVKVLAAIGLNYKGKTDWKIITIHVDDPEAPIMNNIEDVETNFPTMLETTVNYYKYWFPTRNLTLFEEAKDKAFAYKVIADCNHQWAKLMEGMVKAPGMSLLNTCIKGSEGRVSFETAEDELDKRNYPTGRPTTVWGMYDDPYAYTTAYTLEPLTSDEH
uniref:inorganic diphosphatase n=1 Tax=Cacopsylla melanoneura TaxID=428564 RepID=A0A8D8TPK6_9HEMI